MHIQSSIEIILKCNESHISLLFSLTASFYTRTLTRVFLLFFVIVVFLLIGHVHPYYVKLEKSDGLLFHLIFFKNTQDIIYVFLEIFVWFIFIFNSILRSFLLLYSKFPADLFFRRVKSNI